MTPLRLHLGCGYVRMDEWVNADYRPTPATDVVFDVQERWPLPDNSTRVIYASHMLEHLHRPMAFFSEAWRVLEPLGSSIVIRVPYGGNTAAWADLTHVRPWYPASFAGLQPGYGEAVGNVQSVRNPTPFGLALIQVRLSARVLPLLKWYGLKRLVGRYIDLIPEALEEIFVQAYPLKTLDQITQYAGTHIANTVPVEYVAYAHDLAGEPCPASGGSPLISL